VRCAGDHQQQRAARGNRQQLEVALAQVPDDVPMSGDDRQRRQHDRAADQAVTRRSGLQPAMAVKSPSLVSRRMGDR